MSIFGRIFHRKKKIDAQKMIKDFELGRYMLIKQVQEKNEALKKDGYSILTVNPILVSTGRADENSPFGIMISTDNNTFTEFHKYLDMGKYGKNEINVFTVGEYAFLMAIAMDEEKKMAIIYPSAFRREKLEEIQKDTTLYIYVVSVEQQKYTLVYIPNIKWGEPQKIEEKTFRSDEGKTPPPSLYR
ncbi:MAG: hypothetical protein QW743_04595 [Candidatus Methanomethylicia archaeon]